MKKLLIYIVLNCVFLTPILLAQASAPMKEPAGPRPELKSKAAALAESAMLGIDSIESVENQIVLLTLATDLFWRENEKRAREYAGLAAEKLRSKLAPVLADEQAAREHINYSPLRIKDFRRDLVVTVARYDLAAAQELAARTRPVLLTIRPKTESENNTIRHWTNEERDLEQRIAFQAVVKDPAEAMKISRASLALGASKESLNVLRRLQAREHGMAGGFAEDIIKKLSATDFNRDKEASETAAMFLRQMDESDGAFRMTCNCPKPISVDPVKLKSLAGKWLDHAVTQQDSKISFHFLEMVKVLKDLMPDRAITIQAKVDSITKTQPNRTARVQLEQSIHDDKTTPESIAALALKETEMKRFHLYRQAFIKAANSSKAALHKLRESIIAHPDGEEKDWLTNEIAANLAGKTAEDGDLPGARVLALQVTKRDRRIGLLAFIAMEYVKKGDTVNAKQVMDEISAMVDLSTKDRMPKAIVGYDIFPTLFRAYAMTDPAQGANLLQIVLAESAPNIAKSYPVSNVDDGIDLRTLFDRNIQRSTIFAAPLVKLAEWDFDRLRDMTSYFITPELSMLSKLIISQAVLQGRLGYQNPNDHREMIIISN